MTPRRWPGPSSEARDAPSSRWPPWSAARWYSGKSDSTPVTGSEIRTPIVERIQSAFIDRAVVVRSSAHGEDGLEQSAAGRFKSVLDVPAGEGERLRDAVNKVIRSYSSDGRLAHCEDEVMGQPYLVDLAVSGVLLTRDMETGAPYYVLSLDRHSGRSDLVTSGTGTRVDTLYRNFTTQALLLESLASSPPRSPPSTEDLLGMDPALPEEVRGVKASLRVVQFTAQAL